MDTRFLLFFPVPYFFFIVLIDKHIYGMQTRRFGYELINKFLGRKLSTDYLLCLWS